MAEKYIIGIDMGTTNSAVTYKTIEEDDEIHTLNIPQFVEHGQYEDKVLMPSFLYIPNEAEITLDDITLPWQTDTNIIVGEFAKSKAQSTPNRSITSVKSWLCQPTIDKRKGLLPYQAAEGVEKISPLEAYTHFFEHIKNTWNNQFPQAQLFQQKIVITIPASFEPAARDLTVEAARLCDFEKVTLLEEPQASLYGWIHKHQDTWRDTLEKEDIILAIDVGGGTTDFSLIQVEDNNGDLEFKRIAVGNHILVGGDNIDLMLAYTTQQRLLDQGQHIEHWQLQALVHSCRDAKERLLSDENLDEISVIVPGRSSQLFEDALKTTLSREDIQQIMLEGFFPKVSINDHPKHTTRAGINRFSLNYTQDPAITRHLAQFLHTQSQDKKSFVKPKAILFNGGVFKPNIIRKQLLETVNDWLSASKNRKTTQVIELKGADYETSVAYGATIFADALIGHGIKIKGGASHAFYIGIESPMPAIPGFQPPVEALCIATQGMESGEMITYTGETFSLVVGEPVEFKFFAANHRPDDALGDIIGNWEEAGLIELTPLRLTLSAANYQNAQHVPVHISALHTEIGTLELTAHAIENADQWKIAFETIR